MAALLAVVAAAAIFAGFVGNDVRRWHREHAFERQVERLVQEHQGSVLWRRVDAPIWIRRLGATGITQRISSVTLGDPVQNYSSPAVTRKRDPNESFVLTLGIGGNAELLSAISQLRHVTTLNLGGTDIKSDDLHYLVDMPELTYLRVDWTDIDDSVIDDLSRMPQLKSLDLSYTKVTDAGMRRLDHPQKWPIALRIHGTDVSDETIRRLAERIQFTELGLRSTDITDDSLNVFLEMPQLRSLDITRTQVTEEGLSRLLWKKRSNLAVYSDRDYERRRKGGSTKGSGLNNRLPGFKCVRSQVDAPPCVTVKSGVAIGP